MKNSENGMVSPFDKVVDRTETESLKWVYPRKVLGVEEAIPMWVADMDFEAPPAVVAAIKRRAAHGIYGYPLIPPTFWQAAIDWLGRRHGWAVKKDWMAKSPGIVPALNYAVRAYTKPGDGVVIQTPVYHPFYLAVEHNGRRVVRNPLRFDGRRYVMDFDGLEEKIGPDVRMIILCSPHNPVGRVWSRAELERLGRVALEHDLVVFADEIHHDLVYSGHVHRVFAALSPELAERTVTGIAPSKAFNIPGLSTAAIIAPNPALLEAFKLETERAGYELGQVFGVVGFEAAYAHGGEWLDALLPYLEANIDFLERFLTERIPGIRLVRPEGTYLALLDCRGLGFEPDELNRFFLTKAQVYFSDGTIFGRELEGFVRVNFGCPRALLKEALERIERAVKNLGG
jgi:cystathionine beta-lyase